jgi:hypothetical protein
MYKHQVMENQRVFGNISMHKCASEQSSSCEKVYINNFDDYFFKGAIFPGRKFRIIFEAKIEKRGNPRQAPAA